MGYNDPACADMPCRWNHSQVTHVSGCRMEDVLVKKSVRTKQDSSTGISEVERQKSLLKFDPRHVEHQKVTDQQVETLLNKLYILNSKSVVFKSIDGVHQETSCDRHSLPQLGEEISRGTESLEAKRRTFSKAIVMTDNDLSLIHI